MYVITIQLIHSIGSRKAEESTKKAQKSTEAVGCKIKKMQIVGENTGDELFLGQLSLT